MIGTLVNTGAVICGGAIGLLLKSKLPERIIKIIFQAIGLFTLAIGATMAVKMEDILMVVGSLVIGALLGEWWRIDKGADSMSESLKRRLKLGNDRFSEGLVSAFLIFCVGAMTIVGAIEEGIEGKPDLLLTKSLMDFFVAMMLSSAFGVGVLFSAIPLFIFQASLTLLAGYAAQFFTDRIILGLSSVGGILLMGLGIDILEIKKLKLINMLPALIVVALLLAFVK